jgi:type I restriction enzyme, S subunit
MPETLKQNQMFRFDQMAVQVKDKIDNPAEADVDRYVGLEHIDPESLKIRRWGETTDVESSKIIFQSGDIIFGKRRAYQRKLALADFDGICSAHAMVLRPKTDVVLEEFLPFFMQSDIFMDRAVKISVGGLSPTINWRDLAKEEFPLPPLEEQRRIVAVLMCGERAAQSYAALVDTAHSVYASASQSVFERLFSGKTRSGSEQSGTQSLQPLEQVFPDIGDGNYSSKYPKQSDFVDNGVPFLTVADFEEGEILTSRLRYITKEQHATLTKGHLHRGDLLVSTRASIGEIVKVPDAFIGANINAQLVRLGTHNSLLNRDFAWHLLKSFPVQTQIRSRQTGSAQLQLPLRSLLKIDVPVPDQDTQQAIEVKLNAIEQAVHNSHDRHTRARALTKGAAELLMGAPPNV